MRAAHTNRRLALRRSIYLLFTIILGSALPFLSQTPQQVTANPSFKISKDVAVRMRDGVVLRADVLLPSDTGRFPTLVYQTPYNKESSLRGYKSLEKAVGRGYAVIVQDVRGRYASDGEFTPYQTEGRDGYDTIEWAAQQTWSPVIPR
jgi:predicted acyl esterase